MCKKDLLRDIDIQNAISKNYNTTVVYQMVSNILADEMLKIMNFLKINVILNVKIFVIVHKQLCIN